jgi:exopolyphosphatase/pppGpp-phosphohydrolase
LILGAIHISERALRLRVADVESDGSRRVIDRTSLVRAELRNCDRMSALLMAEAETARDAGVVDLEVLATRSLRGTRLLRLLDRVARASGAGTIKLPAAAEELSSGFLAATRPRRPDLGETVAVADITESTVGISVGTPGEAPDWVGSRPLGAATLTRRARFSDPPRPNQIEAAVNGALRSVGSMAVPPCERILLNTSMPGALGRLCGARIDAGSARRGLDSILGQTADDTAAWFGADSGRARLLPATLVIVHAIAGLTGAAVEPCTVDPVAGRAWLAESRFRAAGAERAA